MEGLAYDSEKLGLLSSRLCAALGVGPERRAGTSESPQSVPSSTNAPFFTGGDYPSDASISGRISQIRCQRLLGNSYKIPKFSVTELGPLFLEPNLSQRTARSQQNPRYFS